MIDISKIESYNIAEMVGEKIECPCGHTHSIETKTILCEPGCVSQLEKCLASCNASNLLVVSASDIPHIYEDIIKEVSLSHKVTTHIYKANFHPTLEIAKILSQYGKDFDCVLSIGSGCVTDCAKFHAHANSLPLVSVPTAPSMDGYLGVNSVIIVDGIKNPLPTKAPDHILFDSNIIKTAPRRMLSSGFGDIASKFLSVFDWYIANKATGEFYCDTIARITLESAKLAIRGGREILDGKEAGYTHLTEALIRSSVAMQLLQSTRCASGGEHSTAHVVGMFNTANQVYELMHGEEVMLAYITLLPIYQDFFKWKEVNIEFSNSMFNLLTEKLKLSEVQSAQLLHTLENFESPTAPSETFAFAKENLAPLLDEYASYLDETVELFNQLADPEEGFAKLALSKQDIIDCISIAPAIKERYTTLSLMYAINSLNK